MPDNTLHLPIDDDPEETITLIPPGKLRCIVTGKLRSDTPEEHVRQRICRSLLYDYGYSAENIELEFLRQLGAEKDSR